MQIINHAPQTIIRFSWSIDHEGYYYQDTWEMSEEEWDNLSHEDVAIKQQEQYQKWREYISNPGA
jgi:hypothetical protein